MFHASEIATATTCAVFASVGLLATNEAAGATWVRENASGCQRSWNTPGSVVLSWNLAYTPWETTTSGTSYIRVRIDDGVGFYGYYAKVE